MKNALKLLVVITLCITNLTFAKDLSFTKARLFTGEIKSIYFESLPIAVVVIENKNQDIEKIIATYFVPEAISVFISAKDITVSDDKSLINAITRDPRGFDITWNVEIKDGKLTGVYFQPQDSGELMLQEVIDSSN